MHPLIHRLYAPLILVTFLALFAGCASYGGVDVDTTRKAIAVATTEVRAANLLLRDLVSRDAISDSDARQALGSLRSANQSLQAALDAVTLAGDPVSAGNRLDAANAALSVAITLLSAYVE